MDLAELKELDLNNLGSASTGVKAVIVVALALVILIAGYFGVIKDKRTQLEQRERVEDQLKNEFRIKQQRAVNLPAYRQQLEEMDDMLAELLRQLPSRTEMPNLLNDISQTALGAGIENELFEPSAEVQRDFFAELPIRIRMVGTYHQFGEFVSEVAALPRVVVLTIRDISLQPVPGPGGRLRMDGTISTYRYLEEGERPVQAVAQGSGSP